MSSVSSLDRSNIKKTWISLYKVALDCDIWGQSLEASEKYESLLNTINKNINNNINNNYVLNINTDEESIINKLKVCLIARSTILIDNIKDRNITLEQMKLLIDVIENIFNNNAKFPFDVSIYTDKYSKHVNYENKYNNTSFTPISASTSIDETDTKIVIEGPNTLLPPPKITTNNLTCLVFEIEKLGIKDAENYIDSIIAVTVVDINGKVIEQSQSTSSSNRKNLPYILFGQNVYIQTPIEKLNEFVIFFEFKHYKPSKKFLSTKCFAFMERDEIKESNNIQLELYAKPTDFTRKDIRLLSIKPLYLHMKLTFKKT